MFKRMRDAAIGIAVGSLMAGGGGAFGQSSTVPVVKRDFAVEELRAMLPELKVDWAKWMENATVVEVKPGGESLTEVVKRAKPGTVIQVRAGDYHGMVNLTGVHGTVEAPILLVSMDGPGMARLIGKPQAKEPTVGAWGVSNVGIYGFEIQCDTAGGDQGGVKIGGAWATPAENIVLAGNLITGAGTDGVKFLNGARNIVVAGNVFAGVWREECMDNVSVEKAIFAYNSTEKSAAYWTSLTLKGSSRDVDVVGNRFKSDSKVQLSIGGFGVFSSLKQPPYWYDAGFQAARVSVRENEIHGPQSIAFAGGQDSVVKGNLITAQVTQAEGGERKVKMLPSKGNVVEDNSTAPASVGPKALPSDAAYLRPGPVKAGTRQ